jgi:beta-glucosidase
MVLLKNDEQTLPLSKHLGSVLVVGPDAKATDSIRGWYGPTSTPVTSVYAGIQKAVSSNTKVVYAKGSDIVSRHWWKSELYPVQPSHHAQQMIQDAVAKAKHVDAVIAVVGGNTHTVGESRSRTSLDLPGNQRKLLQALAKTGKPIVAVLINGRPMTINWANKHIPAILEAWFPGEATGTAVARTLFGDHNPGGKLPMTFPKTVGQVLYNFPHKPGSQAPQKGSRTRVNGALYPFGYGLSYTRFKYSDLNVTPETIKPGQSVSVSFRLTNAGKRAGDAIPQLYLKDRYADVIPFDKVLRGFERVHLKPGQSKVVHFKLNGQDMQILNRQMKWQVEPGAFEVEIGSSSKNVRLKDSFKVAG